MRRRIEAGSQTERVVSTINEACRAMTRDDKESVALLKGRIYTFSRFNTRLALNELLDIIGDQGDHSQDPREASLDLLEVVNFTKIAPYEVSDEYVQAVAKQSRESDVLGPIDGLLRAGVRLVKHFPPNVTFVRTIQDAWDPVLDQFTGDEYKDEREYIEKGLLDVKAAIVQEVIERSHKEDEAK